MPIVFSEIRTITTQVDGSRHVFERHVDHNGKTHDINYLADATLDVDMVLSARAVQLGAAIDARQLADQEAANFEVPLSKYQFRQRFTYDGRLAIDAFNRTFEDNDNLTTEQKAAIRTNLEDFAASGAVYLGNPATVAGVQLYEALGLIAAGRAAEILAGGA